MHDDGCFFIGFFCGLLIGLFGSLLLGAVLFNKADKFAGSQERRSLLRHALHTIPNDSLTTSQLMAKFEILEVKE